MDIIAGFPGETPERFEATYDTLRELPLSYLHVFSYSARKGTPAADFEGHVPEREKKARAQRLRQLSDAKSRAYRERFLGQSLEVIVEEGGLQGMSDNYIKVRLEPNGVALQANDRVSAEIRHVAADHTVGRVVRV